MRKKDEEQNGVRKNDVRIKLIELQRQEHTVDSLEAQKRRITESLVRWYHDKAYRKEIRLRAEKLRQFQP